MQSDFPRPSEDMTSEDLASEDLASEDLASEDLASEDLVRPTCQKSQSLIDTELNQDR
jgi:hypothetical protein